MAGIIEKLNYLKTTKSELMEALLGKGQTITEDTPFRDYPDLVQSISSGDPSDAGYESEIAYVDAINGEYYFAEYDYKTMIDDLNGEVI